MQENSKLCLLRLSAIGDVCHAVALVERIQRMRPDIQITWVIGKVEYQLVRDIPGIEFVIFDKNQGWRAYKQLRAQLKGQRFDVLFLMQVALRANLASLCIKAKQTIGFDAERSKELHHLFVSQRIAPQKNPHVLDGFMAFADAIELPPGGAPRWHIPIPESARTKARELSLSHSKFVVICPSASKAERNWTTEGYKTIAQWLQQKNIAVVLCGGPSDAETQLAEKIAAGGHIAANFTGQTSLKELLAILSEASLVIAPDTGPAHMATTVGTPVIGLYAHSNPLRTGPYNNKNTVVSVYDQVIQAQYGKPWTALKWGVRAKGDNLMQKITPEAVQSQIVALVPELLGQTN